MIFIFLLNLAFAKPIDKVTAERCEFARLAAQLPPAVNPNSVCEKPFLMMVGDDIVEVDCREWCKRRRK